MRANTAVKLAVAWSPEESYAGEVSLNLIQTFRVLEGRREVWLAEKLGAERVIAKRFIGGKKQKKESQREIHGLLELDKREIRGPKLLFTAEDSSGGLWVVSSYIENTAELGDVFFSGVKSETQEAAISSFAQTLCLHWCKGVHQADIHNRNYLWDGGILYTIDVGSIRFQDKPIQKQTRIDTLVRTCFKFNNSQLLFFIQALEEAEVGGDSEGLASYMKSKAFSQQLETRKRAEVRRVWLKSQRSSSDFKVTRKKGLRLFAKSAVDPELSALLMNEPDSLFDQGTRLKSGNTCTVQRVELNGINYVVKRYNRKSLFYRFRHIFSMSRVVHSWVNSVVLHRFKVRTPEVVAACELKKFGMLDRGYVVMKCVEGQTLNQFIDNSSQTADERSVYVRLVVELMENLYKYRIIHGDMKAKNFLVENGRLWLIDIDGMKLFLSENNFLRRFEKDQKRFLRNWDCSPEVQAEFLRAFAEMAKQKTV